MLIGKPCLVVEHLIPRPDEMRDGTEVRVEVADVMAIAKRDREAVGHPAATFQNKTGIEIDEKHLRAFHAAIKTGVESALRHGVDASVSTVRAHVVQHLKESVPEALTRLTPGDGVVNRLIERYTLEAINKLASEPK